MYKSAFRLIIFALLTIVLGSESIVSGQAQTFYLPKKILPDRGPDPGLLYNLDEPELAMPLADPDPQAPAASFAWHRIVMQSYRDGNWEVYNVVAGAPNSFINLSNSPAVDARPRVSPDTQKVVFQTNRYGLTDIMTINIDGSGLVRLTDHPRHDYAPAWSPDGKTIVFVSNRDGATDDSNGEIYVMNADGTQAERLTFGGLDNGSPTWSPDGSKIAWLVYNGDYGSLWIMNSDGSNPQPATGWLLYLGHPAWSPDGTKIAIDFDGDGDIWNEIYVVNAGTFTVQLIYDPVNTYADGWVGAWSGDGGTILITFARYVYSGFDYYLYSTNIHYISGFPTTFSNSFTQDNLEISPDWRLIDTIPPVTSFAPLPEYSRPTPITLSFTGYDLGGSGIQFFHPQYRVGLTGEWNNYGLYYGGSTMEFIPPTIESIYFRLRAQDIAENWEQWPDVNGDTFTNIFTWLAELTVQDNRGYPVSNAEISISPAPWETNLVGSASGKATLHLKADGPHSFSASRTGFLDTLDIPLSIWKDESVDLYLQPAPNLLLNSKFENGLANWLVTADQLAAKTADEFSGQAAAILGYDCALPCLSEPEKPYPGYQWSFPNFVLDSHGNIHMVWINYSGPGFLYSQRDATGVWTPPVPLAEYDYKPSGYENKPQMAMDDSNTLHVMLKKGSAMIYLQKPDGGNWSPAETILSASGLWYKTMAVSQQGTVYVIYEDKSDYYHNLIYYIMRSPDGTWHSPVLLMDVGSYPSFSLSLTIGPIGLPHFIWNVNGTIYYRSVLEDGSLSPLEILMRNLYSFDSDPMQILIDGSQQIFVLIGGKHYFYRDGNGLTSDLHTLDAGSFYVTRSSMALDQSGNIHIASALQGSNDLYYFTKQAGSHVFEQSKIFVGMLFLDDASLRIDADGNPHLIWADASNLVYRTAARAGQPGSVTLEQPIQLIFNLSYPTLDFMYALNGELGGQSEFSVQVKHHDVTTKVFSTQEPTDWGHAWVDLSLWAGEAITISFTFDQAVGERYGTLLLDNIAAGGWFTPVLEHTDPAHFEGNWGLAMVTLTGKNFDPGARVILQSGAESIEIFQVEWQDEGALQFFLPADLPVGIYTVWVINPGGFSGFLSGGLRIGKLTYLPLIHR